MSSDNSKLDFAAPVLRYVEGGTTWHYIPLPDDVADAFDEDGVRRLLLTINGKPYNRAILRNSSGERYLIASRTMLREVKAEFGDTVIVEAEPDPDPDNPNIPVELEMALEQDNEAAERFHAMSPGKRRGLAHYVDSAKRPETREKRALEVAHKLRTYTLHGDKARPEI
jgi:hypothetical protein